MSTTTAPLISKTLFLSARGCTRRFWHEVHRPDLVPAPDDAERAVMETGREVGVLARGVYPTGVLIKADPSDPESDAVQTAQAMADPSVGVIFEAAFRFGGEMAKVDVLKRAEGGAWDIVEVKATSQVKPEHHADAAFQLRLLRQNGIPVRGISILYPDDSHEHTGEMHVDQFFREQDVTAEAEALAAQVEADLGRFHEVLEMPEPPAETGAERCKCPFHDRSRTPHPIHELPFLSSKARGKLLEAGILDITDIPADFKHISARQMRIRNAVVSGTPHFDHEALAKGLGAIQFPARFIDFETFQPAVPLYPGTKPFSTVPFQWSLHTLHADGRVVHREFLQRTEADPRYPFARQLIAALEETGSVIVYSSHERKTLEKLGESFPELKAPLDATIARQVDLLQILRDHVYFRDFKGSHSLKSVLPVLVPGLSYKDLNIQNGSIAAARFAEMIRPDCAPEVRERIVKDLLRYCERDTLALLRIFQALMQEIQRRQQQAPTTKPPSRKR